MNGISLCSGIAGLELGIASVLPRYRTVCYVEGEAYAAACLVARMEDGRLHKAPIWSNVRTFDGSAWRGKVDLIAAGYPCQPFSVAGNRAGTSDPRHLWPHIARIIYAVKPAFVFIENVPGHVTLGLDTVWRDFLAMGYKVEAGCFSAKDVGAPHIRNRLFALATDASSARCAEGLRQESQSLRDKARGKESERPCSNVADTDGRWQSQQSGRIGTLGQRTSNGCENRAEWWSAEPDVGRVANGVPRRVDRLRALGNAVVPQCAAYALRELAALI